MKIGHVVIAAIFLLLVSNQTWGDGGREADDSNWVEHNRAMWATIDWERAKIVSEGAYFWMSLINRANESSGYRLEFSPQLNVMFVEAPRGHEIHNATSPDSPSGSQYYTAEFYVVRHILFELGSNETARIGFAAPYLETSDWYGIKLYSNLAQWDGDYVSAVVRVLAFEDYWYDERHSLTRQQYVTDQLEEARKRVAAREISLRSLNRTNAELHGSVTRLRKVAVISTAALIIAAIIGPIIAIWRRRPT